MEKIKRGRITGSKAFNLLSWTGPEYYVDNADNKKKDRVGKIKNNPGWGEGAITYAKECLMKRLGVEIETPTTYAMEWGIEHEPDARAIYEKSRNIRCVLPGYITKSWNLGCIPDGLINNDGILSIKCYQYKRHFDFILSGEIDDQEMAQMQFEMLVTGRKWSDFMNFNPLFPDNLKAKVIRVERDQDYIDLILSMVEPFEQLISDMKKKLNL